MIICVHVARMEEGRHAFKILGSKQTGKRPLGRLRRICEDNIRMDIQEIRVNTRNWVHLARYRDYWGAFVNASLNHRVS